MYIDWFDNYTARGEDFDIIGMSYYPFWHGSMSDLLYNMKSMEERYGKEIVIAEVSMGFTMEDYAEYEKLGPEEKKWLNDYHRMVFEKLSPWLEEDDKNWLKEATKPLK